MFEFSVALHQLFAFDSQNVLIVAAKLHQELINVMKLLLSIFVFYVITTLSQDRNSQNEVYFQYRIYGIDTMWKSLDSINQKFVSGISEDHYKIEIRGLSRNNGETVYVNHIFIDKPNFFWERISFWWLHIVVFLFLFWLIRRYEIKNKYISKKALLEKRKVVEIERMRIARDFHDGAGSSLAQCLILAEVASEKIKNGEIEKAYVDLNLISETIKNLDELLRDIIWSLDPSNNSVHDVIIFFRNYVNSFLKGRKVKFTANISAQVEECKLTSEFRRNVFFILKELLINTCKHSKANNVDVTIDINAKEFKLIFHDDGIGFDSILKLEDSRTKKGLVNIQSRANYLGGNLQIKTEIGEGTKIYLYVPDIEMHNI